MSEKTKGELLAEKLVMDRKHGSYVLTDEDVEKAFAFAEGYKTFMDNSKTERNTVATTIALAEKYGYTEFDRTKTYKTGDKVYVNNRDHAIMLATIGKEPVAKGVHVVAAHVDVPRVDLKQSPLYEDHEMAYFKTHYYGGIRKYQWVAIPLALHGVAIRRDGTKVEFCIGEKDDDPVFYFSDLLPHLAREQSQRTLGQGIKGEELNLIVGSLPFKDDKASEKVKLNILRLLNEQYGIEESDFLRADLEVVPAFKARDVGFDRSMIAAYGHDDRVCGYTSLMAELEVKEPAVTSICILADKEEVGSIGPTGMKGAFFRYFIEDLGAMFGVPAHVICSNSKCLSADVTACFDPTFPQVMESRNSTYLNYGVGLTKFVGSGGKGGSNEATAEYTAWLMRIFDEAGVLWQTGELGRVDEGGGGTVATCISELDIDTSDIGVPVISMHAPYELVSKIDVYSAYRAFSAFIA